MMKQKFSNHFQYNWWVYIVIALTFVLLWSFVFESLAKPAANERLYISFIGTDFNHTKLQFDLEEGLFEESYTREVFVESAVPQGNLNDLLYVRSQGEFDAVILPETYIFNGMADTYFGPLNQSQVTELLGDVTFYEENGQAYGILLEGERFSQYYTGAETCYLFVAPVSQNFAGIFGGNASDDAVVRLIEYLLGGAN